MFGFGPTPAFAEDTQAVGPTAATVSKAVSPTVKPAANPAPGPAAATTAPPAVTPAAYDAFQHDMLYDRLLSRIPTIAKRNSGHTTPPPRDGDDSTSIIHRLQPDRPHQEEAEPASDDDDISRLELLQLQEAGGSGGLQDLLQQTLDESAELGAEPTGLRRRTSAALSPLTAARTALGLGLNPSLSASLGVGGGIGGLGELGLGGLGLGGLGGLGLGGLGLGGLGLGGLGTVNGLGGFGLSPLTLGLAPVTTFPFTGLSNWPLVAPTVISPFMLAQAPFMTLPVPLLGNAGLQVYLAQQQALLSLLTAQGLTLPQQLPLPQTLLPAESLVSKSLSAQAHLAASTKKSLWKQNYLSPLIAQHLQAQKHASGNVQGQLHLSLGANKYASGSLYG